MDELPSLIDSAAEKQIYCSVVQQIIPGGERRRVFFVVTEFFIHLYLPRQTRPDRDPQFVAKYPLSEITKLEALHEVTIRITFRREILILEETSATVLTDIYHNLSCYQHPPALPAIDASLISSAAIDRFVGIQKRYRAILAWQGTFASPDATKSIDRFLKRQPRVIDLGIIADLGLNVPVFLDAISIQPVINTILVPPRAQSGFYELLWQAFQQPTTVITTLAIADSIDEEGEGFYKLVARLSKIATCSLNTIHFMSLDVPQLAIDKLHDLLTTGRLELSFSFTKCNIHQCEDRLYSLIDQPKNLIGIHMTTVWLAESASVKNAMLRLQHISMRGCCVKADEILTMLSRAYAPRVETLDLSKNQCVEPFKTVFTLPTTLERLVMDDVKWNYNNFITLFKTVCTATQQMTFSCVRVQMNDRHWNKFFQAIETCQAPQLLGLIWNDNPVHTKLCQLLLKAPLLKVLCIGGSRVLSDSALQKLLAEHRTLYIIDMHGTSVNRFGQALKGFLPAIKKSKSIRRIDVSHNKMGHQAFAKLVELITSKPTIRQVLLDDNDLPNYQTFEPLVHAIQARERPFYCRYPEDDMAFFNRSESFSEERLAAIRSCFRPPESPLKGPGHEQWLKLIYQNYPEALDIEEAKQPIPRPEADDPARVGPVQRSGSNELLRPLPEAHSPVVPMSAPPPVVPPAVTAEPIETPQAPEDGVSAPPSPSPSVPAAAPAPAPVAAAAAPISAPSSAQQSGSPSSQPIASPMFDGHAPYRPPDIEMDFVDVPPIDNTQIYATFQTVYSIQALTQRLRSLL
jgi:hypothetical protein